ncbi:MAG TPA: SIS domain-containing protein [Candidatus Sulfotelmatobacter sp.]|nr:SIS domain-containing protein [Candidatus Sulfotelmatobacter sp.]
MDIQSKIKAILAAEAAAISAVEVDRTFEQAIALLEQVPGKVVATGMGKAGYIAHKFAATLCSTGTPAVFVHPGEAAHGDLGLIAAGDCIVAFSTSGKTREVVELIEFSEHLGTRKVIAITSHPESDLRPLSDVVLDMGEIAEPCPLGLTPTASIAVMSAIGDALALVLMERKGITKRDYGLRHHGGYLGAKARLDNV